VSTAPEQPGDLAGTELARLADEIADRLAQRLGPALAELLVELDPLAPAPGGHAILATRGGLDSAELWSARQVAAHYGVGAGFVYEHANELGCIRLGGGPRARLRFDPQTVRDRWSTLRAPPPTATPRTRRRQSATSRERRAKARGYELIEYDREP
jgi:hypothetical protein